ncbi:MAG: cation:proton antiporter [Pelagimonas sp.]|jgi:CPA2 family monovalent cation:H+ antiporter-2|nr:cation:proton antiporter [Pelagimonas sp.]
MTPEFMLITFILFLAGAIAVPIASRLGLGSVLGYLIAGIAISPILSLAGADVIAMQHFAEFGVVMMLFLIGLEMNPRELWEMRHRIFVLGGLQIGLTTIAAMGVAMVLGQPWSVALAIGLVLALSSTAIVNQTLKEKGLSKSDGGRASFAVLLAQDIAVIPMLALVPLLALPELTQALSHGDGHTDHHDTGGLNLSLVDGLSGWQTTLVTLLAVGGVIALGRYVVSPLFRFVSRARLRELFVSTALMLVLGIALLMTLVGLSPALGTFLAGVVLASSEYRHELESDIDPFRGLFLGVFFITVGAGINFGLLASSLGLVLGLTVGLIALKAAILLGLARIFKLDGADKWLFGLGLAQAGEFGFVLLSFTVANAVIPAAVSDILLLVVALSMLLTPALFIVYDRLIAPRFAQGQTQDADEIENQSKIIIAGHGRVGGIISRALTAAGYSATVVDYSSEQLEFIRRFGLKAYFGDATRPDLLAAAGLSDAKVIVVAIDGKEAITDMVRYICKHHPNVHVVARAYDRNHVYDLWSVGCRDIIRETYDSSVRMARSTFEALGFDRAQASNMMQAFDTKDREIMLEMAKQHDFNTPMAENEAAMAKFTEMRDIWEEELNAQVRAAAGHSKPD